ncbi:hypothetical protein RUND412_010406 [Rhizina undulata]
MPLKPNRDRLIITKSKALQKVTGSKKMLVPGSSTQDEYYTMMYRLQKSPSILELFLKMTTYLLDLINKYLNFFLQHHNQFMFSTPPRKKKFKPAPRGTRANLEQKRGHKRKLEMEDNFLRAAEMDTNKDEAFGTQRSKSTFDSSKPRCLTRNRSQTSKLSDIQAQKNNTENLKCQVEGIKARAQVKLQGRRKFGN